MVSQKTTLINAQGFHMRPATMFANSIGKYESDITIKYKEQVINAKSLMNILTACMKCGSEIEIICDGPDENEALKEAVSLVESGLGE